MRDPSQNPFVPGSDHVPAVWAGRRLELADSWEVLIPRRAAGVYERGRVVLGEPGIGKSVLLNRIASEAGDAGHLVPPAIRLASDDDPIARSLQVLRRFAASQSLDAALGLIGSRALARLESISFPVVGGGVRLRASAAEPVDHTLLTDLLSDLALLAGERGKLLLLRVDEVQHLRGARLSQLLTAFADTLSVEREVPDAAGSAHRRVLPFAVYLSGLPEFALRANEAGATFARRFKLLELEPLTEPALHEALLPFTSDGWEVLGADGPSLVHMDPAAVGRIVGDCHGSPYLFQLLGEAAWNAGTSDAVTGDDAARGIAAARREVQTYHRLRVAGLSAAQLAYLRAAATLVPRQRTAANVAAALGARSEQLGSTARALDERYRLIRRAGGHIVFRSPGLEGYLADLPDYG